MGIRTLAIALIGFFLTSCEKNDLSTDRKVIGNTENNGSVSDGTLGSEITGLSVWHWGSETRYYGINNIILDESKSKETIDSYLENKVTRV